MAPRFSKKRNYRRRSTPWWRKKYSAFSLAKKAWSAAKYVKSLVNVEKKYFDKTDVNINPTASGTVLPYSQIAQGDAYNQRDGNSVKANSLLMRCSTTLNTSAESTFVRCILFIDNEQNASTPTVANVLESVGYLSPLNHVNGSRFAVLKDKTVTLKKDMNAVCFKWYLKLRHHIKFSSGTATDTREGNIYLLLISSEVTNVPDFDVLSRLRFIDN